MHVAWESEDKVGKDISALSSAFPGRGCQHSARGLKKASRKSKTAPQRKSRIQITAYSEPQEPPRTMITESMNKYELGTDGTFWLFEQAAAVSALRTDISSANARLTTPMHE